MATENASINQYGKMNAKRDRLSILNLFLLTTIGLMGYVSFDSLEKESSSMMINQNKISLAIEEVVDEGNLNQVSSYIQELSKELK